MLGEIEKGKDERVRQKLDGLRKDEKAKLTVK